MTYYPAFNRKKHCHIPWWLRLALYFVRPRIAIDPAGGMLRYKVLFKRMYILEEDK